MKKCWVILVLGLLLCGCGTQETFEPVSDVYAVPVSAEQYELKVVVPEEAAVPAMEGTDGGKLYLCDGYTVTVQTLDGGDLNRTLRETTGFDKEALTVMQTAKAGIKRYECAWSAAGEGEDAVGRAVILDNGAQHYVVTVMANYTQAGQLQATWQHILDSVTLVSTG